MLALRTIHHVFVYFERVACFRRRYWSRGNLLACVSLDINSNLFRHVDAEARTLFPRLPIDC